MPFRSSETEFAWAVGLFEGEGSIHKYRRARVLQLRMTDEDTVTRFHSAVGVGKVLGPYFEKEGHKPMWHWRCGFWPDVAPLLRRMYPSLGARRAERAAEMLADTPNDHYSHHREREASHSLP